jgi:phosphatidylserine decarboxylase
MVSGATAIRSRDYSIAQEGVPFVLIGLGLSAATFLIGGWGSAIVPAAGTFFVVWFFRNPERHPPEGEGVVVSPADGTVIEIREEAEKRFFQEGGVKIAIFMNVFNVHVNRVPAPGRIVGIRYHPGRFLSANREKASLENEQNAILLEDDQGRRIVFIQIAGFIARRIACWIGEGDRVERGQRCGLIRFGSRVDVYLPKGAEVRVSLRQRVRAGETILGVLPCP